MPTSLDDRDGTLPVEDEAALKRIHLVEQIRALRSPFASLVSLGPAFSGIAAVGAAVVAAFAACNSYQKQVNDALQLQSESARLRNEIAALQAQHDRAAEQKAAAEQDAATAAAAKRTTESELRAVEGHLADVGVRTTRRFLSRVTYEPQSVGYRMQFDSDPAGARVMLVDLSTPVEAGSVWPIAVTPDDYKVQGEVPGRTPNFDDANPSSIDRAFVYVFDFGEFQEARLLYLPPHQ